MITSTSPIIKRKYEAMVKRFRMSSIAFVGFSTRSAPDMMSAFRLDISDAPIMVSCEKNATPISRVTTA